MTTLNQTIFAVASGSGKSGVAVVRISGQGTKALLKALTGRTLSPRVATYCVLRHPVSGEVLDQGLVLWFPGPKSYTGEDCAELQIHGGRAVVAAVIGMLGSTPGVRPAEAGEFTRRAFDNGKMDLAQVEGLADLIDSETEHQRAQALAQLGGLLGKKTERWRASLIHALSLVEAEIDFPEEGDAPVQVWAPVGEIARKVKTEIDECLKANPVFERLRDGLSIVVCGPPNVGKSTFFNKLANRDAAIVSDRPGTTRDALEVNLDLGGIPMKLVDTAGFRRTRNTVETEGIERARQQITRAELVLWLFEKPSQARMASQIGAEGKVWLIRTKADLLEGRYTGAEHFISARTGEGMDRLIESLTKHATELLGQGGEAPLTRERHRIALAETSEALGQTLFPEEETSVELVAEDLRLAALALGRITGRVDVEEILNDLFSHFCIGK